MKSLNRVLPLAAVLAFIAAASALSAEQAPWRRIDDGLHLVAFDAPQKSTAGDSKITVLKIDPKNYALKLLSASENGNRTLTAKQWCEQHKLVAAINAGMYQADGVTHVAYLRNFAHVNNPRQTKDKAFIAFNRTSATVPEIQIIDTQYQDLPAMSAQYNTLIQNIRAVCAKRENVWTQQPRTWSIALLGMDENGNVLFLFTRSPYSMHDFVDMLLALPISLHNAAYLEGGPPATLYLSANGVEMELVGSYETGVFETDSNRRAWPLPNVIGVVRRGK